MIITTYKRPTEFIGRAIRSVVGQTYPDIELIVVDDNPDDLKLSAPVIEEIKALCDVHEDTVHRTISIMSYPGNRGACYARNYGASHSSGEYIAFLDDDDEMIGNKIEEQVISLDSSEAVMVTCDAEYVITDPASGEIIRQTISSCDSTCIDTEFILQKGNVVGGCSYPLIRRNSFDETGGFTEGLPSAQDYDLWIRLTLTGTVIRIPKPLVRIYWHEGERISTNVGSKLSGLKYITGHFTHLADDRKGFVSRQHLDVAEIYFGAGRFFGGMAYVSAAVIRRCSKGNIDRSKKLIRFGISRFRAVRLNKTVKP